MAETNLTWGSKEWRTHLRRSLAQRKRYGENITDIEGLIDYIETKGPKEGNKSAKTQGSRKRPNRQSKGSSKLGRRSSTRSSSVGKKASPGRAAQGRSAAAIKGVSVQEGRRSRGNEQRQHTAQPKQHKRSEAGRSSQPSGVKVVKVGNHEWLTGL